MFSQKIKELRKKNNLTKVDLANKIGVSPSTISSWENNLYKPRLTRLVTIAVTFDITMDYWLGLIDSPCCILPSKQ